MPRPDPPCLAPEQLGDTGIHASHDGERIWLGLVPTSQLIPLGKPTLLALLDYADIHHILDARDTHFRPPREGDQAAAPSGGGPDPRTREINMLKRIVDSPYNYDISHLMRQAAAVIRQHEPTWISTQNLYNETHEG